MGKRLQMLLKAGDAVVPYLAEYLMQENPRARAGALEGLGELGAQSPELMVQILQMLNDERTRRALPVSVP